MPIITDHITPADFDGLDSDIENDGFTTEESLDSDSIVIDMPEPGAIVALQQLSERLSSVQREYIKTINTSALSALADSIKQAIHPINSSVLSEYAKTVSLVSQIDLQRSMKPVLTAYSSYIKTLNTPLLSDSLLSAFEKIQFPALAFSKIAIQTPMIEAITSAMVNMDYLSCFSIANEALDKPRIIAPDVAFFRTTELAKAMKPELAYPYGFSTALKSLNKSSAFAISDNPEIFYDVSQKGFSGEGIENNGIVLSKELNVVCSAKEVIDSVDEGFITELELMDFMSFLFETPSFASSHPAGQKIYQFIQGFMNKDNKYKHGFDHDVFYHSRARKADEPPFIYDDMLKVPIGIAGPGRYNNPGRSHYYFCDSAKGAESEVKKHNPDKEVQTIKLVPVKQIVLLDLSGTMRRGEAFLRYLRFPLSSVNNKTPREYLIPCYVAECCMRIGFDGIKYYGGNDYSNYVAWTDGYFKFAGNV